MSALVRYERVVVKQGTPHSTVHNFRPPTDDSQGYVYRILFAPAYTRGDQSLNRFRVNQNARHPSTWILLVETTAKATRQKGDLLSLFSWDVDLQKETLYEDAGWYIVQRQLPTSVAASRDQTWSEALIVISLSVMQCQRQLDAWAPMATKANHRKELWLLADQVDLSQQDDQPTIVVSVPSLLGRLPGEVHPLVDHTWVLESTSNSSEQEELKVLNRYLQIFFEDLPERLRWAVDLERSVSYANRLAQLRLAQLALVDRPSPLASADTRQLPSELPPISGGAGLTFSEGGTAPSYRKWSEVYEKLASEDIAVWKAVGAHTTEEEKRQNLYRLEEWRELVCLLRRACRVLLGSCSVLTRAQNSSVHLSEAVIYDGSATLTVHYEPAEADSFRARLFSRAPLLRNDTEESGTPEDSFRMRGRSATIRPAGEWYRASGAFNLQQKSQKREKPRASGSYLTREYTFEALGQYACMTRTRDTVVVPPELHMEAGRYHSSLKALHLYSWVTTSARRSIVVAMGNSFSLDGRQSYDSTLQKVDWSVPDRSVRVRLNVGGYLQWRALTSEDQGLYSMHVYERSSAKQHLYDVNFQVRISLPHSKDSSTLPLSIPNKSLASRLYTPRFDYLVAMERVASFYGIEQFQVVAEDLRVKLDLPDYLEPPYLRYMPSEQQWLNDSSYLVGEAPPYDERKDYVLFAPQDGSWLKLRLGDSAYRLYQVLYESGYSRGTYDPSSAESERIIELFYRSIASGRLRRRHLWTELFRSREFTPQVLSVESRRISFPEWLSQSDRPLQAYLAKCTSQNSYFQSVAHVPVSLLLRWLERTFDETTTGEKSPWIQEESREVVSQMKANLRRLQNQLDSGEVHLEHASHHWKRHSPMSAVVRDAWIRESQNTAAYRGVPGPLDPQLLAMLQRPPEQSATESLLALVDLTDGATLSAEARMEAQLLGQQLRHQVKNGVYRTGSLGMPDRTEPLKAFYMASSQELSALVPLFGEDATDKSFDQTTERRSLWLQQLQELSLSQNRFQNQALSGAKQAWWRTQQLSSAAAAAAATEQSAVRRLRADTLSLEELELISRQGQLANADFPRNTPASVRAAIHKVRNYIEEKRGVVVARALTASVAELNSMPSLLTSNDARDYASTAISVTAFSVPRPRVASQNPLYVAPQPIVVVAPPPQAVTVPVPTAPVPTAPAPAPPQVVSTPAKPAYYDTGKRHQIPDYNKILEDKALRQPPIVEAGVPKTQELWKIYTELFRQPGTTDLYDRFFSKHGSLLPGLKEKIEQRITALRVAQNVRDLNTHVNDDVNSAQFKVEPPRSFKESIAIALRSYALPTAVNDILSKRSVDQIPTKLRTFSDVVLDTTVVAKTIAFETGNDFDRVIGAALSVVYRTPDTALSALFNIMNGAIVNYASNANGNAVLLVKLETLQTDALAAKKEEEEEEALILATETSGDDDELSSEPETSAAAAAAEDAEEYTVGNKIGREFAFRILKPFKVTENTKNANTLARPKSKQFRYRAYIEAVALNPIIAKVMASRRQDADENSPELGRTLSTLKTAALSDVQTILRRAIDEINTERSNARRAFDSKRAAWQAAENLSDPALQAAESSSSMKHYIDEITEALSTLSVTADNAVRYEVSERVQTNALIESSDDDEEEEDSESQDDLRLEDRPASALDPNSESDSSDAEWTNSGDDLPPPTSATSREHWPELILEQVDRTLKMLSSLESGGLLASYLDQQVLGWYAGDRFDPSQREAIQNRVNFVKDTALRVDVDSLKKIKSGQIVTEIKKRDRADPKVVFSKTRAIPLYDAMYDLALRLHQIWAGSTKKFSRIPLKPIVGGGVQMEGDLVPVLERMGESYLQANGIDLLVSELPSGIHIEQLFSQIPLFLRSPTTGDESVENLAQMLVDEMPYASLHTTTEEDAMTPDAVDKKVYFNRGPRNKTLTSFVSFSREQENSGASFKKDDRETKQTLTVKRLLNYSDTLKGASNFDFQLARTPLTELLFAFSTQNIQFKFVPLTNIATTAALPQLPSQLTPASPASEPAEDDTSDSEDSADIAQEAREKAAQEAREKAAQEAREKAAQEAREKAAQEAREKAAREAQEALEQAAGDVSLAAIKTDIDSFISETRKEFNALLRDAEPERPVRLESKLLPLLEKIRDTPLSPAIINTLKEKFGAAGVFDSKFFLDWRTPGFSQILINGLIGFLNAYSAPPDTDPNRGLKMDAAFKLLTSFTDKWAQNTEPVEVETMDGYEIIFPSFTDSEFGSDLNAAIDKFKSLVEGEIYQKSLQLTEAEITLLYEMKVLSDPKKDALAYENAYTYADEIFEDALRIVKQGFVGFDPVDNQSSVDEAKTMIHSAVYSSRMPTTSLVERNEYSVFGSNFYYATEQPSTEKDYALELIDGSIAQMYSDVNENTPKEVFEAVEADLSKLVAEKKYASTLFVDSQERYLQFPAT